MSAANAIETSPAPGRATRAPVRVDHKRAPTDDQFSWAIALVDGFGEAFMEGLRLAVGEGRGRPGSVNARAVLVAWALLVTENEHKAEVTDATAQLVALSDAQLLQLNMTRLPVERAYKRFHDKLTRVRNALESGFTYVERDRTIEVNLDWWTTAAPQRAIPADLPSSTTRAVDGTDWETAGRFRSSGQRNYDGDAPVDTDDNPEEHAATVAKTRRQAARKREWEIGPDGRAIHTTDRDARGGYRTATAGRNGGLYVGSEVHLIVQTRDFSWSGQVQRVNDGPNVPHFVTGSVLAPSGTHRATAVIPAIVNAPESIATLVWDRGYSILPFETAHGPLIQAGIQPVFDLSSIQRTNPAVSEQVIWLDGHPFHEHTPEHLRNLARPPMGSTAETRAEYESRFNERAAWRWSRLAGPDKDGVTRWSCPFHEGRLKCRAIRQRKVKASAPLVQLPAGVRKCCEGTLQLSAEYLNLIQACAIPYGTTAHSQAYGRRNLVETANSYFGGTYVDLTRTYSRLMGHKNRKFVLGMLLAGLNRYIERSWRALQAAKEKAAALPQQRAKRRKGTLADLIDHPAWETRKRQSRQVRANHTTVTPLRT